MGVSIVRFVPDDVALISRPIVEPGSATEGRASPRWLRRLLFVAAFLVLATVLLAARSGRAQADGSTAPCPVPVAHSAPAAVAPGVAPDGPGWPAHCRRADHRHGHPEATATAATATPATATPAADQPSSPADHSTAGGPSTAAVPSTAPGPKPPVRRTTPSEPATTTATPATPTTTPDRSSQPAQASPPGASLPTTTPPTTTPPTTTPPTTTPPTTTPPTTTPPIPPTAVSQPPTTGGPPAADPVAVDRPDAPAVPAPKLPTCRPAGNDRAPGHPRVGARSERSTTEAARTWAAAVTPADVVPAAPAVWWPARSPVPPPPPEPPLTLPAAPLTPCPAQTGSSSGSGIAAGHHDVDVVSAAASSGLEVPHGLAATADRGAGRPCRGTGDPLITPD